MTVNRELLLDTKHVQEQRSEITLKRTQETLTKPHSNNHKKGHLWVPARTPTVHRCPQGKAVGGPQHDPQWDKRATQTGTTVFNNVHYWRNDGTGGFGSQMCRVSLAPMMCHFGSSHSLKAISTQDDVRIYQLPVVCRVVQGDGNVVEPRGRYLPEQDIGRLLWPSQCCLLLLLQGLQRIMWCGSCSVSLSPRVLCGAS